MTEFMIKNESGLASKLKKYKHKDPAMPEIRLFPMVHIGESEFYEDIYWEKLCCDTVLLECAVGLSAKIAGWLYEYVANLKHLKLSWQGKALDGKKRYAPK